MSATPGENFAGLAEPVTEQDHSLGPRDAPITLVEYGDYECPDCFNAVPVIQEVRKALGDRLRIIFRHYPQSSIHPHASTAAEAAEAAAEQGKFWEMHQALFKHQKELGTLDLSHLALTLGLEIYQFETSRTRDKHLRRIQADFESGQRSGVKGTPTFFINGRKYVGPTTAAEIIAAAERASNSAEH
jgi:protein-disulfide isomerase